MQICNRNCVDSLNFDATSKSGSDGHKIVSKSMRLPVNFHSIGIYRFDEWFGVFVFVCVNLTYQMSIFDGNIRLLFIVRLISFKRDCLLHHKIANARIEIVCNILCVCFDVKNTKRTWLICGLMQ